MTMCIRAAGCIRLSPLVSLCMCVTTSQHVHIVFKQDEESRYGVATIGRLHKIIGLF